ncbi:MAG: EAL domain-containing protein [Ruminococcus sp.]|nr:EAL domain-containing protein [Ruminococcus sp.]
MGTREMYFCIFAVFVALLSVCTFASHRSSKSIGNAVTLLCGSLITTMIGNMVVIASEVKLISVIGYYIYFLGYDYIAFAIVRFTDEYCRNFGNSDRRPTAIFVMLAADVAQILISPFTGHLFHTESIALEGAPYYRIVPHFGLTAHRVMVYLVMGAVMLIFLIAALKTARIYRGRYTVVLFTMFCECIWQGYYIISRKPIDRSMIGLTVFGLLVFYFTMYYRPLRLLDRMLSNIVSDMPDALFVFDPTGKCIWANEHGLKLAGVDENSLEEVYGRLKDIFGDCACLSHYAAGSESAGENIVIGSGDEASYYSIERHSVKADSRHLAGSFLTVHDVTEEQREVKRELYNSTHDSLTDLYTKQYLFDRIEKKLAEDENAKYYAVFVDVKNFKIVNDVFGSDFGDIAIRQIADWIRSVVTEGCVYGRLAGDTFGLFIPEADFDTARFETELANFVARDGSVEYHLLIHFGVYEVDDRALDVSVMYDRAHLSLSSINDQYKTHIAYYDKALRERVLWDQQISAALSEAIAERQVCPYLQPITDAEGRVVGAEALARWIHPERGFLSPASFIPVFEKNGMIVELDRYMWKCACEILAKWKGVHDGVFISVNISPKDFYFFDVVSELKALVKDHGIDPADLRVEITETVMMSGSEDRMKILAELREAGFIVEMDDFGSGYSSLNLLKDMPVDVLKIDMKFLSAGLEDGTDRSVQRSRTILKNVLRLSAELDIASLTEGVETEQQFAQLAEMGCKLFQGYYFSKPLPVGEFESFAFSG